MDLPKISLSFSKILPKKQLKASALSSISLEHVTSSASMKQTISTFDKDTNFVTSNIGPHEAGLVIPLIESERNALFGKQKKSKTSQDAAENKFSVDSSKQNLDLDTMAAAAVIAETKEKLEEFENRASDQVSIHQNIGNSLDPSNPFRMGKDSTLEDYEKINVESYGSALLRGMGWSKERGVGKNNKCIEIMEPVVRNFGLTTKTSKRDAKDKDGRRQVEEEEVEQQLVKGCLILIHSGRNKGTYGTVETVDEDHVLVRTALGDRVLREVEQNVRNVSAKEYKEYSRVINKETYDQYKAAEAKKKEEAKERINNKRNVKDRDSSEENNDRRKDRIKMYDNHALGSDKIARDDSERRTRQKQDSKYSSSGGDQQMEHYKYKNDQSKSKSDETLLHDQLDNCTSFGYKSNQSSTRSTKDSKGNLKSDKDNQKKGPVIPWTRENLRVRIIDKEYKGGRYYKEKVVVQSIETVDSCTCITDDGKLLYDIKPSCLESVIPKTSLAVVLILKGSCIGQRARILQLHKGEEKASVQLLADKSIILKFHYDDICEFVAR